MVILSCGSVKVLQMQKKSKGHSELGETSIASDSFVININVRSAAPCDKDNKQDEKPFGSIFGTIRLWDLTSIYLKFSTRDQYYLQLSEWLLSFFHMFVSCFFLSYVESSMILLAWSAPNSPQIRREMSFMSTDNIKWPCNLYDLLIHTAQAKGGDIL